MLALPGAVTEGTLAMGRAGDPGLEHPWGSLQCVMFLPMAQPVPAPGVSLPPPPSPLLLLGEMGTCMCYKQPFLAHFASLPAMHSHLRGDAQHLPVPPTPPSASSTPLSPMWVQNEGLRCCWRLLISRFSRLPASPSLEEDLLLSQGVTASREPPNLYLHCNLSLSLAVRETLFIAAK